MLITLAQLKSYLGITDATHDAFLTDVITQASAYVESVAGISFTEVEDFSEELDGSGIRELLLSNTNITSSTTFLLEGRTDVHNESNFEEIESREYFIDNSAGIVKNLSRFCQNFNSR